MSRELAPEMSAVVVTPDCYASVRETIRHLRAQTVCASLEARRDAGGLRRSSSSSVMRGIEIIGGVVTVISPDYFRRRYRW